MLVRILGLQRVPKGEGKGKKEAEEDHLNHANGAQEALVPLDVAVPVNDIIRKGSDGFQGVCEKRLDQSDEDEARARREVMITSSEAPPR